MLKLRTTFAAAALAALSLGAIVDSAAAMPSATPSQLGLATADTGFVQKTAVVCGRYGCRRIVGGARVWVGPHRRLYAFAGPGGAFSFQIGGLLYLGLARSALPPADSSDQRNTF